MTGAEIDVVGQLFVLSVVIVSNWPGVVAVGMYTAAAFTNVLGTVAPTEMVPVIVKVTLPPDARLISVSSEPPGMLPLGHTVNVPDVLTAHDHVAPVIGNADRSSVTRMPVTSPLVVSLWTLKIYEIALPGPTVFAVSDDAKLGIFKFGFEMVVGRVDVLSVVSGSTLGVARSTVAVFDIAPLVVAGIHPEIVYTIDALIGKFTMSSTQPAPVEQPVAPPVATQLCVTVVAVRAGNPPMVAPLSRTLAPKAGAVGPGDEGFVTVTV